MTAKHLDFRNMVLKENEIEAEVEDVESQQIEHIRREQQNTVEQDIVRYSND